MKTLKGNRQHFRIGLIASTIVALHVLLCLYTVFIPDRMRMRNKVITIYKQLFVLGPFFTESRIKASHYLSVRYKQEGNWSPSREFAKEHFLLYSGKPWRYDRLPYNDYEKRIGYSIGKLAMRKPFETVKTSSSFKELNEFILEEFINAPVDSINLIYGWNVYVPKTKSYTLDTVFNYTYNPGTIGKAKK